MDTNQCRKIKMVMVGDMAVGKTSLANVFVHKTFRDAYTATLGAYVLEITLEKPQVTLQIWDTAGMERFRAMLPHFTRNTQCAVLVYDVCNRKTFESLHNYWINYIEESTSSDLVKVLVGNKIDVGIAQVDESEGHRLARAHNMMFAQTSAKLGLNVEEMFVGAAKEVVKKIKEVKKDETTVPVTLQQSKEKPKSSCCDSTGKNYI